MEYLLGLITIPVIIYLWWKYQERKFNQRRWQRQINAQKKRDRDINQAPKLKKREEMMKELDRL